MSTLGRVIKNSKKLLVLKNGTVLHYVPNDPSPTPWRDLIKSLNKSNHKATPQYVKKIATNFRKAFFSQYFHDDPRSEEILKKLADKINCANTEQLSQMFMQGKVNDQVVYETLQSIITVNLVAPSIKQESAFLKSSKKNTLPALKFTKINNQKSYQGLAQSDRKILSESITSPGETLHMNITINDSPQELENLLLGDFVPQETPTPTLPQESDKQQSPMNLESLHDFLSNAEAKRKVITFLENSETQSPKTFNWEQSLEAPLNPKSSLSDLFRPRTSKYSYKNISPAIKNDSSFLTNQFIMYDVSSNTEHELQPVDLLMMNLTKKDLFAVINGCTTKQPQHILEVISKYVLVDEDKWNVYGTLSNDSNKIIFKRHLPKSQLPGISNKKKTMKIVSVSLLVTIVLGIGLYESS